MRMSLHPLFVAVSDKSLWAKLVEESPALPNGVCLAAASRTTSLSLSQPPLIVCAVWQEEGQQGASGSGVSGLGPGAAAASANSTAAASTTLAKVARGFTTTFSSSFTTSAQPSLGIRISDTFSQHYGVRHDERIWLHPIAALALTEVTFVVPTSLDVAPMQEQLQAALQLSPFLARAGDWLLSPPQLGTFPADPWIVTSKNCTPYTQGLVTLSTRVHVVAAEGSSSISATDTTILASPTPSVPPPTLPSLGPLLLSDFAQVLGSPARAYHPPSVLVDAVCRSTSSSSFPVSSTPSSSSTSGSTTIPAPHPCGYRVVWLPLATMLELGIEEGSWVEVERVGEGRHPHSVRGSLHVDLEDDVRALVDPHLLGSSAAEALSRTQKSGGDAEGSEPSSVPSSSGDSAGSGAVSEGYSGAESVGSSNASGSSQSAAGGSSAGSARAGTGGNSNFSSSSSTSSGSASASGSSGVKNNALLFPTPFLGSTADKKGAASTMHPIPLSAPGTTSPLYHSSSIAPAPLLHTAPWLSADTHGEHSHVYLAQAYCAPGDSTILSFWLFFYLRDHAAASSVHVRIKRYSRRHPSSAHSAPSSASSFAHSSSVSSSSFASTATATTSSSSATSPSTSITPTPSLLPLTISPLPSSVLLGAEANEAPPSFAVPSLPSSFGASASTGPTAAGQSVGATMLSFTPPSARAVYISMVPSAQQSSSGFDEALKVFFSTNQLLAVGDVFGVCGEGDTYSYFQVNRIDANEQSPLGFLVCRDTCALYLHGQRHTYVPFPAFEPPVCFVGDSTGVFSRFQNLLEALLDSSLPLTRNVLVRGPRLSGKTTLVQAVAAQAGAQVVSLNCGELAGETPGKVDLRLRDTARRAAAARPCLILLRNVDLLGAGASAQDPHRGHGAVRIASSLSELVSSLTSSMSIPVGSSAGGIGATSHPCYNPSLPSATATAAGNGGATALEFAVVLVGTTSLPWDAANEVLQCFVNDLKLESPGEPQRLTILRHLLARTSLGPDVCLARLAQRTSGLGYAELRTLVTQAQRSALHRIRREVVGSRAAPSQHCINEKDLCVAGVCVRLQDVDIAVKAVQAGQASLFGTPHIPNVAWEDIGGLADAKTDILDTIQLPLEHPELISQGLRRSGVLLYGPPGVGKTLLAKAVATQCALNFLSVKGPELLNMYVGQSEANVRDLFARARAARPCVIFFDELDALAPQRGRSGDSGGVMDRVVAQLLAELDGITSSADVFIIAATNRPDLVDHALLRPGRLDKLIYLGISGDKEDQRRIFRALTRKFSLADGMDEERVLARCPATLTGADFYALCADAMLRAMKRAVAAAEQQRKEHGEGGGVKHLSALSAGDGNNSPAAAAAAQVVVCTEDFVAALDALTPSVSTTELRRYEALRRDMVRK